MVQYRKKIFQLCLLAVLIFNENTKSFAWDGIDTETNSEIEIGKGELVRRGHDITIYDYEKGYRDVSIENITRFGSTVEIEVYDWQSGEYTTLEMEDN